MQLSEKISFERKWSLPRVHKLIGNGRHHNNSTVGNFLWNKDANKIDLGSMIGFVFKHQNFKHIPIIYWHYRNVGDADGVAVASQLHRFVVVLKRVEKFIRRHIDEQMGDGGGHIRDSRSRRLN